MMSELCLINIFCWISPFEIAIAKLKNKLTYALTTLWTQQIQDTATFRVFDYDERNLLYGLVTNELNVSS